MKDLSEANQKLLEENTFLKQKIKELELSASEHEREDEALGRGETGIRTDRDAIVPSESDDSLPEPELGDILDIQAFQPIMTDFFNLTHIPNAILDVHGKILVANGWQDICIKFHRVHPETVKHCLESDTALTGGVEPGTFKLYQCKNNMWDIVTPITVRGKHMGNIFLGQFIFEDEAPDRDSFRAQARRYGFDEEEYLEALERVSRVSRKKINDAMTFCTKFAHLIAMLNYGHIRLARTLTERNRLLHSLREKDELFKAISSNTPDHLVVQDSDLRYSLVINPQLDLTEQDMIGKTDHDFLSKEDADELTEIKRRVLKTGSPIHLEVPLMSPNGEQQFFDGSYVPKFDANGHVDGLIGYFRNVTDRKQVEEELRSSERKYRNIFENATEGIFQSTPEGRYVSVNPAFARIGGYDSPHEMIDSVADIKKMYVHQEDRARLLALFKKQDVITNFEAEIRRRDNAIIWISMNVKAIRDKGGKIILLEGTIEDITERKQAEQLLIERETLLNKVGTIAKVGGWEMDMATGKATWSKGTYDIVEIDYDKPIPGFHEHDGYYLPEYREMVENKMKALVETKQPMQFEAALKTAKGTIKWCQALGEAVIKDGNVVKLRGTFQDITERKKIIEEIQALNRELEQRVAERTAELAERTRQMETFTYSVSHDLKAPLRGIDGYSRLLLEDYSDRLDEEGRTFLTTIRQATEQMRQLIEDLLAYSRMERRSLASQEVHPLYVMRTLLAERAEEINARNVSVTVDMPDAVVKADSDGLAQVLRNLLDNALKFTGNIPDPHIAIGGQEKKETCIFWVRDNGIGFDMRYHDRIFEIFQRLHPVEDYPGTGIGMAIVQKAMQRMGGRVWAESAPGKGTAFYLEVPK